MAEWTVGPYHSSLKAMTAACPFSSGLSTHLQSLWLVVIAKKFAELQSGLDTWFFHCFSMQESVLCLLGEVKSDFHKLSASPCRPFILLYVWCVTYVSARCYRERERECGVDYGHFFPGCPAHLSSVTILCKDTKNNHFTSCYFISFVSYTWDICKFCLLVPLCS